MHNMPPSDLQNLTPLELKVMFSFFRHLSNKDYRPFKRVILPLFKARKFNIGEYRLVLLVKPRNDKRQNPIDCVQRGLGQILKESTQ